jgi:hypothetical protein
MPRASLAAAEIRASTLAAQDLGAAHATVSGAEPTSSFEAPT